MSFLHPSDTTLYQDLCVLLALVLGGYALWLVLAGLRRSRPDLRLGRPVAAAFLVRILAALTVGQLSIAEDLRGGDELTFLHRADDLTHKALLGTASLDKLTGELHSFLFSLNLRVFNPDPPLNMLRIEMITLAVIGSMLLAAAVYELAGPRPARIAAWVLAFEPANVFFSSLLHKEPFMFLAEGAVVYGGAVFWKRGKLTALLPMILGCLVAVATRPYAGWFLSAAAAVVVLHASITRQQGLRAVVARRHDHRAAGRLLSHGLECVLGQEPEGASAVSGRKQPELPGEPLARARGLLDARQADHEPPPAGDRRDPQALSVADARTPASGWGSWARW